MDSKVDPALKKLEVSSAFCEIIRDKDELDIKEIPAHSPFELYIWNRSGSRRIIPIEVIDNARELHKLRRLTNNEAKTVITWEQAKPYMNYEAHQPVRVA